MLAIALFAVVTASLGELRAIELWSTTWDLGIYQQALWSTAHGHAFYEAADLETGGYGSFLQVHSALVLYALVPIYAAFPVPLTLFAVQSAVVGLAALPLYALVRSRGGSSRAALVVACLYLLWAPTLGGTLYDVHIEALLPLVYLTAAYGWSTRRYVVAAIASGVGFLTMEFVPVLLFFLGAFLILEELLRPGAEPDAAPRGGARLRAILRRAASRPIWPLWALLAGSLVAYAALIALRLWWLHDWFAFPPYPAVVAPGYVTGASSSGLGVSTAFLSVGLFAKLSMWLLAFALLGFLPLLYPRSLLLVLPWLAFTLFTPVTNFVTFGFQYWFFAAGPLFVGAAYAVPRAAAMFPRRTLGPARARSSLRRFRLPRAPSTVALAVLLLCGANLALSPLNPLYTFPTAGSGYQITYDRIVPSSGAFQLAALVPANAEVVASDDLFPLVANDLNAYSLLWMQDPNLTLPFDLGDLPQYVFISEFRLPAVPPFLTATLYDRSDYGVRGVAWTSPTGPALLFELGFAGPTSVYGTAPSGALSVPPTTLFTVAGLLTLARDPAAPGGAYAASVAGASGLLWDGPWTSFAPGNYTVSFGLRALPAVGTGVPSAATPILALAAGEFAQPSWFYRVLTYGELEGPTWHTVALSVEVTAPTLSVTWPGYGLDASVEIDIAGISSTPVA